MEVRFLDEGMRVQKLDTHVDVDRFIQKLFPIEGLDNKNLRMPLSTVQRNTPAPILYLAGKDFFVLGTVSRHKDSVRQSISLFRISPLKDWRHPYSIPGYIRFIEDTKENIAFLSRQVDIAMKHISKAKTWKEAKNIMKRIDSGRTGWKDTRGEF